MLSFRRKILLTDLVILILFISLLFPLVGVSVNYIMRHSLTNRAKHLIGELELASSESDLIDRVRNRREFAFQPLSILDSAGNVIYQGDVAQPEPLHYNEPEIQQALHEGVGFSEHRSRLYKENYYYIAIAFNSHGQQYILHTDFISKEIDQIKTDFKIGALILSILLLIITTSLDILTVYLVTRPIQKIINVIRSYQEGKEEFLPRIVFDKSMHPGEFSKLAFLLNSLTDRVQRQIENLTSQREETEEILESLGEGIIATDPSARVTFVNQTACRMLQLSREALMKKSLDSISEGFSDLSEQCHESILHALQTGTSVVHTWTKQDSIPLFLDLISAPLAHQNGALLVLQDKTSDYQVVQMGKDFIANASHELRTPITIIRGFAETLQDLPEISKEMLHDITEKIVRTCGRLDKLVRSLLTLADMEHIPEDRFKNTDLVMLAENCKHLMLAAYPKVRIEIETKLDIAPISADSDLLELAILNLLENSVKYSADLAEIKIHIERIEEEVALHVSDRGIGISESDLPRIFDRFYTVDKARSRKSGGAGLGLSIVKTIVEKHKGRVTVRSTLGQGSVFTITLPLRFRLV